MSLDSTDPLVERVEEVADNDIAEMIPDVGQPVEPRLNNQLVRWDAAQRDRAYDERIAAADAATKLLRKLRKLSGQIAMAGTDLDPRTVVAVLGDYALNQGVISALVGLPGFEELPDDVRDVVAVILVHDEGKDDGVADGELEDPVIADIREAFEELESTATAADDDSDAAAPDSATASDDDDEDDDDGGDDDAASAPAATVGPAWEPTRAVWLHTYRELLACGEFMETVNGVVGIYRTVRPTGSREDALWYLVFQSTPVLASQCRDLQPMASIVEICSDVELRIALRWILLKSAGPPLGLSPDRIRTVAQRFRTS